MAGIQISTNGIESLNPQVRISYPVNEHSPTDAQQRDISLAT